MRQSTAINGLRGISAAAVTAALAGMLAFGGSATTAYAGTDKALVAQADLPSRYDLREQGLVTPVKQQEPWGSCWAFGGIAAAESSILSRMGTTYDKYPLDLSEAHLVWYGSLPVTAAEDEAQAGEGTHMIDREASPFTDGGDNFLISTLFSSGTGPVLEEVFPYRGVEGLLETDSLVLLKDQLVEDNKEELVAGGAEESFAESFAEHLWEIDLQIAQKRNTYSSYDDWSIPETDEDGLANRFVFSGFTLRDGNVLPDLNRRADEKDPVTGVRAWQGVNSDGVNAVKRELLSGNAVMVALAADVSLPGVDESGYSMNLDTWAQYCFEDAPVDHGVCIVGWDDRYPAKNFTHEVFLYDDEGEAVLQPELTRLTTPAGDGAWLVKNSWGSETDAVPGGLVDMEGVGYTENLGFWGIEDPSGKHTGYFWVSYFDKSLTGPETYEFDIDMSDQEAFGVSLYDYMPSTDGFWTLASRRLISTANEFVADDDSTLVSVSTRTAEDDSRVDFQVLRLGPTTVKPTDGELLAEFSEFFEYEGYHRADLPVKVDLDRGERYAVVSTASTVNDRGERVWGAEASRGLSRESAERQGIDAYSVAVVNPGESFLRIGDNWVDWATYQKGEEFKKATYDAASDTYSVVDNFAIKAFTVGR